MTLKDQVQKELAKAGIILNGPNPWDVQVHDERVYGRILARGSMGLGESYVDGWWDVPALDQFFDRILSAGLDKTASLKWQRTLVQAMHSIINFQTKARAFQVGEQHYDIGNDLYTKMLDKRLVYTCGYWKDATTLDEAQEAKLDLICRKLKLQAGQTVLDIGCGWGSFAKFAAERYGVSVVGTTISKEQAKLARELCAGLPVEIRIEDYRDTQGQFDHIVSIGMFEHVGPKNYRTYMKVVSRCLKPEGLFLLHTIGGNKHEIQVDPWIDRYIFPNGVVPSMSNTTKSFGGLFVMEDWQNFGAHYDKTLMAWHANFEAAWPELEATYGPRFKRMWDYYLLVCAASFRARVNQLWQIVLSPKGVPGGYTSVR
jgi:cyclopropane-fatty-acyl-phospholipid synthase